MLKRVPHDASVQFGKASSPLYVCPTQRAMCPTLVYDGVLLFYLLMTRNAQALSLVDLFLYLCDL